MGFIWGLALLGQGALAQDVAGMPTLLAPGQFVYGPNVGDFDLSDYLRQQGSPLAEKADVLETWSAHASVNPRLVLTIIELQSGLVTGNGITAMSNAVGYPIDGFAAQIEGLTTALAHNFYDYLYTYGERSQGPRAAALPSVATLDGSSLAVPVGGGAGDYAILATLAPLSRSAAALDEKRAQFAETYRRLFPADDPLDNSNSITPQALPPDDFFQLPFPIGQMWWFNGAHNWVGGGMENDGGYGRPYSSIDFGIANNSCQAPANAWAVAAAGGNGYHPNGRSCWFRIAHGNGWMTSYYHLQNGRADGSLSANTGVGTISCEACVGGFASSPHVHLSLLYNGAYVDLDGVKFSGWQVNVGNGGYATGSISTWRRGQEPLYLSLE